MIPFTIITLLIHLFII